MQRLLIVCLYLRSQNLHLFVRFRAIFAAELYGQFSFIIFFTCDVIAVVDLALGHATYTSVAKQYNLVLAKVMSE